jgi:spore germination cell wall hydrolase CwlJ-like protein
MANIYFQFAGTANALGAHWNYMSGRTRLVFCAGVTAALISAGCLVESFEPLTPSRPNLETARPVLPISSINAPASRDTGGGPVQMFRRLTPEQAEIFNAKVPIARLPNPAAEPFTLPAANATERFAALTCLTAAIYYEAASQSDRGQAAVAQIVLNRLRNPLFPKSICGVVFQGSTLPTGCQFTFTCDGSLERRPSQAGWRRASAVAERALDGYVETSVGEATHYHTTWVVPYWQATVVKVTQIGTHIFYRWDGSLGTPAGFRGQYAGGELLPPQLKGLEAGATRPVVAAPEPPQGLVAAARPAPLTTLDGAAVEGRPPMQLTTLDLVSLSARPSPDPDSALASRPGGAGPNQRLAIPSHW